MKQLFLQKLRIKSHALRVWMREVARRYPDWKQSIERLPYLPWLVFTAFAVCATLLLVLHADIIPFTIREGDVAQKNIKADQNYEIPDTRATDRLRENAVNNVLPVYAWETKRGEEMVSRLERLFDTAASELEARKRGLAADGAQTNLKEHLQKEFQFVFDDDAYAVLENRAFAPDIMKALKGPLMDILALPIVDRRDAVKIERLPKISVLYLGGSEESDITPFEETWDDFNRLANLDDMKRSFGRKANSTLEHLSFNLSREELHVLVSWFAAFIVPTFTFDRAETEARQQRAVEGIKDVVIKVKAGEMIIRAGDRFNAWHKTVLEGIRSAHRQTNAFLKFVGILLLFSSLSLSLYYFAVRYMRLAKRQKRDLYFLELSLLLGLLVLRVGVWFASVSRDALPVAIDVNDLYYIIPLAGLAMLVRMMLSAELTFLFTVLLALLGGIYLGNSLEFALYHLVTSIVGIHAVSHADKRVAIMRAGFLSGLAGVCMVLILYTISVLSMAANTDWEALFYTALFALAGGVASGMLALSLAPFAEFAFHYATDIKLLELANLNHPLLKDMIVRAPGTYHHSHLVGILSEAGARAIGANPLLSRVACYYHDIGKMCHADYFIENQRGGPNRHDHLSPAASAAVIAAHVRDGIELGKAHKLPPSILDMIPQHQGTKIMTYFYEKAKSQSASSGGQTPVDETLFRYPGPKPQSREAGIIMIADATEAAVRSLPEKTKENIESMVKKLMNRHFSDGQFDECELTLQDLHLIAQSFVHVLTGIYHHRVQYPEAKEEERSERIFVLDEIRLQKR